MKKRYSSLLVFLFTAVALLSINSCKKHSDDDDATTTGPTITTTVTGRVVDETNASLAGVTVTAYGQTTTTDPNGLFVLTDLNADKSRCILHFTKAGFFDRAHAIKATANTINYVRIVLNSNAITQTFGATSGATVTSGNASVVFPPNAFVTAAGSAYTGTVSVALKHLSPDNPNFGFCIPGGDLAGVNTDNDPVALYSYGMLGVVLTGSSGEPLQLATGTTATLTMAVAAAQLATAPPTLPLWYFDEATSLWKEQGTATLTGGNYVGTVTHFSWWNCDYQGPRATLKGKVVDCNGDVMPNVNVTVNGWYVMTTNQNGEFTDDVPVGMTFTVQVLSTNNQGIQNSQLENIPILTNGQVYLVPTLVVPCPARIAGVLKNCTGGITTGLVKVSDGTIVYNYQYTDISGHFSIPVSPNSLIALQAISNEGSNTQTVTSLAAPNILNLGNILLCDTIIPLYGNNFTVNCVPFSNKLFDIVVSYENSSFDSLNTMIHVIVKGKTLAGDSIDLCYINISDTTLGAYPFTTSYDKVDITAFIGNEHCYIESVTAGGGTIYLTEFGPVGGRIKGYYLGAVEVTYFGFPNSGTFSGNFDVLRTQ